MYQKVSTNLNFVDRENGYVIRHLKVVKYLIIQNICYQQLEKIAKSKGGKIKDGLVYINNKLK